MTKGMWLGVALLALLMAAAGFWWFSPAQQQQRRNFILTDSCTAGNLKAVEDALAEGADPNARDRNGITPLMEAAKGFHPAMENPPATDHPDVVKLLLEHGAKGNAATDTGFVALFYAARYGHEKAAKVLIEKGANVNAKDKDGLTALKWATTNRNASPANYDKVIALLKEAGAKE